MKIAVLDGRTLNSDRNAWAGLDALGEVHYYDVSEPGDVYERARGASILVVNKCPVRRELMARLPDLRYIAVTATGFDCVDVAAARERGIPVSNVPEYSTRSVAQFTFALLLELCHRVGLHDRAVKDGEWTSQPDFSLRKSPQVELAGKTMGIVGFGRIGRQVAEVAAALGMTVAAHRPSGKTDPAGEGVAVCTLDELFERSDVVSLHCPLTDATRGMVDRDRLRRARSSLMLINTARGALVVEQDLADALNSHAIAGAAVDVVVREPIAADNPLLNARNCIIAPHIAWTTDEARQRLLDSSVTNVRAFLDGQPVNVVN